MYIGDGGASEPTAQGKPRHTPVEPQDTQRGRKRATIHDVARLAGVSYGTVSRYLNGNRYVSQSAAERIASAIAAVHYTPNNAACALVRQRTSTVAMIIQIESNETIGQHSVSEAIAGANQTLGEAGYQMVTLIANTEESTRRIMRFAYSDFADGYLLFSLIENDSLARAFCRVDRPAVRSESGSGRDSVLPYPAVDFTNMEGQRDITRYLLAAGRSRLAYIAGPEYSPAAAKRLCGFREAMSGRFDETLVRRARDWEMSSGEESVRDLRPMLDGIDGIVCANDSIAVGAVRSLKRLGYRVPDDIAVTGFDDAPLAALCEPPLTTVHQDSALHGETMARLLLSMMDGTCVPDYHVELLPTTIVERESV